ncbi:MAG: 23S rRNA (guanosine(2251)-2'-O)-methyltransferase RlmB [Thermodesulfobacteriota bacterium]
MSSTAAKGELEIEILYGHHPIAEALKAGRRSIVEIFLARDKSSPRLAAIADKAYVGNIPVSKVPPARLSGLAGSERHQGVCARVSGFPYIGLDEVLKGAAMEKADRSAPGCLLLLDSIQDPHNLGALIRTAYCAGVDGVVIPKDRCATPSPAVSRISAGALEHTRLVRTTNLVKAISVLKSRGLWVSGLDRAAGGTLFSTDFNVPLAIVVGSEEKGLRPLVKKNCDMLIGIPQMGEVDSLNASVAGGIVMYEVFRQRLSHAGNRGS